MKQQLATFGIITGIVVALAGIPMPAVAADPVGSVVALRGEAHAKGVDGHLRPLQMKSPVFVKDLIVTGAKGRMQLTFQDQSFISLGSNTSLEIKEYLYDATTKKGAMVTKVDEGVFRVVGGMITKFSPEKFKTETPTASIGTWKP